MKNNVLVCVILCFFITICSAKKDEDLDSAPPAKGKSFFLFGAIFRRIRQRWMGGSNEPGPLYAGPTYPIGGYYNCPAYGCSPVYGPIPPPPPPPPSYYNQPYYPNVQYFPQPLPQQQQQHQQQHPQQPHQNNVVVYNHQDQIAQHYPPQQYQVGAVPMPLPLHPGPQQVVYPSSGAPYYSNVPNYPAGFGQHNYPLPAAPQNSYNTAYQPGQAAGPHLVATSQSVSNAPCVTPKYPCATGK